jgi:uncharacterized protein YbjT (DUF2867 family)
MRVVITGATGNVGTTLVAALAADTAVEELVSCPIWQPSSRQTSRLARRVAADLARCDWNLELTES